MVGTGVPEGRFSVAMCCRQQVPGRHGRLKLAVDPKRSTPKFRQLWGTRQVPYSKRERFLIMLA